MKKSVLIVVFSVATSILIITGCSKKNDAQSYSTKQLAGTYKLTASSATVPGIGTVDLMASMQDCEKQALQTLKEDSTYAHYDACYSDTSTGKFVVKGNLFISDPDSYPDTVTIKSFNGSTLVFTFPETEQGVTFTTTMTFTKQ